MLRIHIIEKLHYMLLIFPQFGMKRYIKNKQNYLLLPFSGAHQITFNLNKPFQENTASINMSFPAMISKIVNLILIVDCDIWMRSNIRSDKNGFSAPFSPHLPNLAFVS